MNDKHEVYKSIVKITAALSKEGISKDRKNQQQGFAYRGIDDCYAALSPLLAEHNLCIMPRITERIAEERQSAKGGILFYTAVTACFDIVSAVDGSTHTVISYGEAFDSGDKSIGKAMSYAYKAMAFMLFAIPTEGDNDPDAHSHEVKPKTPPTPKQPSPAPKTPALATPAQVEKLQNLLLEWCGGDVENAKLNLNEISKFEKDGTVYRMDWDKLDTYKGTGIGAIIGKVEKAIKDGEDPLPF